MLKRNLSASDHNCGIYIFLFFYRTLWGSDFYSMIGSFTMKSWTGETGRDCKKCPLSQLSSAVPTLTWKEPNISLLWSRAWGLSGQEWILGSSWKPLGLSSPTLYTHSQALLAVRTLSSSDPSLAPGRNNNTYTKDIGQSIRIRRKFWLKCWVPIFKWSI